MSNIKVTVIYICIQIYTMCPPSIPPNEWEASKTGEKRFYINVARVTNLHKVEKHCAAIKSLPCEQEELKRTKLTIKKMCFVKQQDWMRFILSFDQEGIVSIMEDVDKTVYQHPNSNHSKQGLQILSTRRAEEGCWCSASIVQYNATHTNYAVWRATLNPKEKQHHSS